MYATLDTNRAPSRAEGRHELRLDDRRFSKRIAAEHVCLYNSIVMFTERGEKKIPEMTDEPTAAIRRTEPGETAWFRAKRSSIFKQSFGRNSAAFA